MATTTTPSHNNLFGRTSFIQNLSASIVSTEAGRKAFESIATQQATYRSATQKNGDEKAVVMGYTKDMRTGEWELAMPSGLPSDFIGRAKHSMNLTKKKVDIRDRLRAKLAAKKKVKKETHTETCECGAMLGGRDDWDEDEFDEHPDREAGYDEDGQWHCPECREDK